MDFSRKNLLFKQEGKGKWTYIRNRYLMKNGLCMAKRGCNYQSDGREGNH
ncbi:hypothetical protein SELR_pSRC100600 (plasmid) [Selenomonas ruminantium subsp. lactilytica TAM6421]|uniref:Uncharacterized protein n=1 Tax=Selenomonas ruminantium subsp. lactilytica (strain NBRC 103574 / TAM6421) TaxID=927704 RepID=I0GVT0_SELRL|nr:hypothetical protein SELR_pSRC100600 [Selenomonas ruminantium subsp. lactilytica TAM6421]